MAKKDGIPVIKCTEICPTALGNKFKEKDIQSTQVRNYNETLVVLQRDNKCSLIHRTFSLFLLKEIISRLRYLMSKSIMLYNGSFILLFIFRHLSSVYFTS
jgi:hypothetical protein